MPWSSDHRAGPAPARRHRVLAVAAVSSGLIGCGAATGADAADAATAAPAGVAECATPTAVRMPYRLSIPEPGLDDPAAYEGYRTRFFRDAAGNTVQVYIKERDGRVVNLWGDAANESVGFTARDPAGAPAALHWADDGVCVSVAGGARTVEWRARAGGPELELGHFLLGSMRVERDFQYPGGHLEPFAPSFVVPELLELVELMGRLPAEERLAHARRLDATGVAELEARLRPTVRLTTRDGRRIARIERPSLDGRSRLRLEVAVPERDATIERAGDAIRIVAREGRPLVLSVGVTTDAPPLTPLDRDEIFNADFRAFLDRVRSGQDEATSPDDPRALRHRRLERQVRGLELLGSREKLMAGLPNYATYFGRDMLVTALLMQPIWAPAMNEHVIASVLRKLSPDGQVSHEEALGGQAIREHAARYNDLLRRALDRGAADGAPGAAPLLDSAAAVLDDIGRVRENYAMVDDEYQFPVLVARYLAAPAIPAERKRAFLLEPARAGDPTPRLTLLLRNLALVADRTAAYAREPVATNLVSFPRRPEGGYHAASWRDSGAGYGGGRFAMDVNAIWVPNALESTRSILEALDELGLRGDEAHAALLAPDSIDRAVRAWRGARRHFEVRLAPEEARARIARKLASLPENEARHWAAVVDRAPIPADGLPFLALSLDEAGEPIGIMGTDMGTRWFLDDLTAAALEDPSAIPGLVTELTTPFLPYPVGLLVDGLGPLVANDAYATPDVWAAFERDTYHSPRVVWGREVNLLLLGLMRQIDAAHDDDDGALRDPGLAPYVAALEHGLRVTLDAVEASGLAHNEVWSYRLDGDRLQPIRWGNSSDAQLWNLTNLVVEFQRDRQRGDVESR